MKNFNRTYNFLSKAIAVLVLLLVSSTGFSQLLDEDFDSGIPVTWTITDGGGSADTWHGATDYSGSDLDGTPFLFVDSDAAGSVAMDEIIESPAVSCAGYSPLTLEFDQYFNSFGTEDVEVDVWNGSSWVNVYSHTHIYILQCTLRH